jgi:acyl-CoA oxidase
MRGMRARSCASGQTRRRARAAQAMADLFALQRIHGDVLFRNDDYVAAEKAKAIGRLLEHLRRELRELALPLVDAWNIPVRV